MCKAILILMVSPNIYIYLIIIGLTVFAYIFSVLCIWVILNDQNSPTLQLYNNVYEFVCIHFFYVSIIYYIHNIVSYIIVPISEPNSKYT